MIHKKIYQSIHNWMNNNKSRFVDSKTGELNHSLMVETWDQECSSGVATLRSDHVAWEIAAEIKE